MTGVEFLATPPRRPRLWLRSLTSRLVVGVVALVVVLVLAIGSGTYYFLNNYLLSRLDQQVATTASAYSPFIVSCVRASALNPGGQTTCAAPQAVPEWVAILDPNGQVEARLNGYNVKTLDLTPAQSRSFIDNPLHIQTVHQGSTELRAISQQSRDLVIVTGLSTYEVGKTMHRLIRLELLIGAAAVLISFAATWLGVQRSLRNLYRVTRTAQEVAAELSPEGAGLDRRVPLVEEGTEVGQLAESMNTLLAAVETQFRARVESEERMRQFLADASHELRTPLTSIRGYAELARMQRAAGADTHTAGGENLDRIESEGTRMSRLVDDLLLLARGDADGAAHAGEREPIDLADVLDDAVSGSRAAYPDRRIDLDVDALPAVFGNRDQLLRVVRNLVTNAAVHTEAGRPILVRGFSDAEGAVIQVADGGPGLPAEQAAHVFERFWRADKARTRARGGSGLGLSIVAAIVRAHGGTVRFDSAVETGSTVTIWLPAMVE
ncbi:MAG TPA: HAMP domain-containing sensor histidine kinase [Jatrophihabitans sp.]|nr:HAMP domain-containing sensor histidine kinase [Jatrophihabitans sp.]